MAVALPLLAQSMPSLAVVELDSTPESSPDDRSIHNVPERTSSFNRGRPVSPSPSDDDAVEEAIPSAPRTRVSSHCSSDSECLSRQRPVSSSSHARVPSSFVPAIRQPATLNSLLKYLPWQDCSALLATCRDCRHFFRTSELRDVILARFVPGYFECLRHRDPRRVQELPVSLEDLHLLREFRHPQHFERIP